MAALERDVELIELQLKSQQRHAVFLDRAKSKVDERFSMQARQRFDEIKENEVHTDATVSKCKNDVSKQKNIVH